MIVTYEWAELFEAKFSWELLSVKLVSCDVTILAKGFHFSCLLLTSA